MLRCPLRTTSYLICSTPRTGSSLLCDALTATGVAGRPEEYFQFRARTGFPRRPQEYFEGADGRRDLRHPGAAHAGRGGRGPLRPQPLRALRGLPGVGARRGHDAERRVRRQGDVGLLQRVRDRPALGRPRPPAAVGVRARALGVPRPALPLGDPARQGASGRLAVAGAADVELVERPGARRRHRAPRLQPRRHRPPDPRHRGPRVRVAGLLPRVRRRAAHDRVRGLRGALRGAPCATSCATWRSPRPRRRPSPRRASGRQSDDLSRGWADRYRAESGKLAHA